MYNRIIQFTLLAMSIMVGFTLAFHQSTATAQTNPGTLIRINLNASGAQADGHSDKPSISAEGRFIAFESFATNLVANDTNGKTDIFVYDRFTRQTTLVSVSSQGVQTNASSYFAAISGDGRYIAFTSTADNLTSGDRNGYSDLFLHDRQTGQTVRLSQGIDGGDANGPTATKPVISYDGRYVAFQSEASNLVPNDLNAISDVFVYDSVTGQIESVSRDSSGIWGNSSSLAPSISMDGRYVAFRSFASNLVSGDVNGKFDIFLHDRQTHKTNLISVASDGTQSDGNSLAPDISAHGRHITFLSDGTNLVPNDTNGGRDVFLHDMETGETKRVNLSASGAQANGDAEDIAPISAIGQSFVFKTTANNLVSNDLDMTGDIIWRDITSNDLLLISRPLSLTAPKVDSYVPDMSPDGRYIVFSSFSFSLVPNDTNQKGDIFLYDRGVSEPTATPTVLPTDTPSPTPTPTDTPTPTPTPTATPLPVSGLISPAGGNLSSEGQPNSKTLVQFPANAVSMDTLVTYSYLRPMSAYPQVGLDRFFRLDAIQNGQPIFTTTQPITIVIRYNDLARRGAIPNTLYLYRLSNGQWITDDITFVARGDNILTSTTTQFTTYGVLGQTNWHYIPIIMR